MVKRPKNDDIIECQLDSYNRHGVAVGTLDSWRVEVPGAFVGERVRGRIGYVAKQSKRLFLRHANTITPLPERREAPCLKQQRCDGCPWMQLSEPAQRQHKLTLLRHTFGLVIAGLVQQPGGSRHYRWSSKRVVTGKAGQLRFGSYRRGSHTLANMRGCLVDHPDITRCLEELLKQANRVGIAPYDATSDSGELRYLWLKTNGAGAVLLTLVCRASTAAVGKLAQQLRVPSGVYRSIQDSAGNAMRGHTLTHLCGARELPITLCGINATIGPLGFLQPNPLMAERCYVQLVHQLHGEVAYDLYAGPGIASAMLRRNFKQVLACDTVVEAGGAAPVSQCSTEAFLDKALAGKWPHPDAIVCNPPRAGLSDRVCRQLKQLCDRRPFALRIMSCNPQTFARDRDRLTTHFNLIMTRAFDTLPQTHHLELVGHFLPAAHGCGGP